MNRNELINKLSERTVVNKRDIRAILDAFTEIIIESTKSGDRILISDLGSFKPRIQTSRPARNPRNGEVVQLTPRTIVHFKCASKLLERINKE